MTDSPDTAADVVERPVLRVVRGTPDAVEVAALVAVFAAAGGAGAASTTPPRRAAWSAPARSLRTPPGSGGWRASAAPR